jgi:hypothetical protein
MTDKQKKVLTYSLLGYTIGGLLIVVGLSLQVTVALVTFYIIGMFMVVSAILSLYNNYKLDPKVKLYIYLVGVGILLGVLFTTVCISQLL